MENGDDFTFCQQVGVSTDENGLQIKDLARDISGITVGDDSSCNSGRDQNGGFPWRDQLQHGSISKNEAFVGSLTTDASSPRQRSTQVVPSDDGTSVKNVQEYKISSKKPAVRAKVPFEKGYSQMDWLKLTRTHPDLAGLKGQSNKRLIPMSEVKQHRSEGSMWTVLKGRVYNISPYMRFHPGGADILMKAVGKDCTALFNKYHAWVNAEFLLEKCLVGILDETANHK